MCGWLCPNITVLILIQVLHNSSPLSKSPPLSNSFALVSSSVAFKSVTSCHMYSSTLWLDCSLFFQQSELWHQSFIWEKNDFSTSSRTFVQTFRSSNAELHLEKVTKALIARGSAVFLMKSTMSMALSWTIGGSHLNPKTRNAEAQRWSEFTNGLHAILTPITLA